MPDIVLFGATGYTGRLTAEALARRGLDFAIAGRNPTKLDALARSVGASKTHVAEVGDVGSLAGALEDSGVLVTCVGPFAELGWTAVEAAIEARVHYIDSAGEGSFIHELIERTDGRARDAGIAMAPAMGFDEVPADVAVTLAAHGLERADIAVTYATPTTASAGTIRSALGIMTSAGWRVESGRIVPTRTGEAERWAPLPPPLGVRKSISAPLGIGRIAPMHLDLARLIAYLTTGDIQRLVIKAGLPLIGALLATGPGRAAVDAVVRRLPEGPGPAARQKKWTILAEARAGDRSRNVVLTGEDLYGLTAELLAAAAAKVCTEGVPRAGVLAPVEAIGSETLQKELIDQGVTIDVFERRNERGD